MSSDSSPWFCNASTWDDSDESDTLRSTEFDVRSHVDPS